MEEGIFYAVPYEVSRDDVLSWRAKLVVLPAPTLVVLEYADMWVRLSEGRYRTELEVDAAFDIPRYDLKVFVEGEEYCYNNPIYGDEGYYKIECGGGYEGHHAAVQQVSAEVQGMGGLRCQRSEHSNADRTLFACSWR